MDNSLGQHDLDSLQANGLLVSLKIFDFVFTWLVGLILLTEEGQKDAGIYFGYQPYK